MWASVSALWTRAGRFPMRRACPCRAGRAGGSGPCRPNWRARTPRRPRSGRGGARWSRSLGVAGRLPLGDGLRNRGGHPSRPPGCRRRCGRPAQAPPEYCAPSSTRCGDRVRSNLSLSLAGSLSMPLTTTVPPRPAARATASLMAAGNPATAPAGQTRRLEGGHQGLPPSAGRASGTQGPAPTGGRPGRSGGRAGGGPARGGAGHASVMAILGSTCWTAGAAGRRRGVAAASCRGAWRRRHATPAPGRRRERRSRPAR